MTNSTLFPARLDEPLRAYALTIEESAPGEFRWRILEDQGSRSVYESVCCSEGIFAAYDTALATGYGELQRLVGPDLQFGPRHERPAVTPNAERLEPIPPSKAMGSSVKNGRHIDTRAAFVDGLPNEPEEARA